MAATTVCMTELAEGVPVVLEHHATELKEKVQIDHERHVAGLKEEVSIDLENYMTVPIVGDLGDLELRMLINIWTL